MAATGKQQPQQQQNANVQNAVHQAAQAPQLGQQIANRVNGQVGAIARDRITTMSDLANDAAKAEDPGIEQLVAEARDLIAAERAAIKFPGPGYKLNGGVVPAAPDPALASPRVRAKLITLIYKLANEHRAPNEAWPLADYSARSTPELSKLANNLLAERNAKLEVPKVEAPPQPPAMQPFSGQGTVLGGTATIEEARARQQGAQPPPKAPMPASAFDAEYLETKAKDIAAAAEVGDHGMIDAWMHWEMWSYRPQDWQIFASKLDKTKQGRISAYFQHSCEPSLIEKLRAIVPAELMPAPVRAQPRAPVQQPQRPQAPGPVPAQIVNGGQSASPSHGHAPLGMRDRQPGSSTVTVLEAPPQGPHVTPLLPVLEAAHPAVEDAHPAVEDAHPAVDAHAPGAPAQEQKASSSQPDNAAAARGAYRRVIATGRGWGSDVELAVLADVLDATVNIWHESPTLANLVTIGHGSHVITLVHVGGNHYNVIENGRVVPIPGDGDCAFAAFWRARTGHMPSKVIIAALRLVAAHNVPDEAIDHMLAARDGNDQGLRELNVPASSKDEESDESEDDELEEAELEEAELATKPGAPGGDPHGGPQQPALGPPPAPGAVQPDYEKPKDDLAETMFSEIDGLTGTVGNVGADGVDNFGQGEQYWENGKDTSWYSGTEKAGNNEAHGVTLGVGDMLGALGGTAALATKLAKIKKQKDILLDKTKPAAERAQAFLEIGEVVIGVAKQYAVLEGGLDTAIEHGTDNVVHDHSDFGFTANGGNMLSTDFRLAGDAAGVLGEIVDLGVGVLKLVNNDEGLRDELMKGPMHEKVGRIAMLVGENANRLAKLSKTMVLLVSQIQGHGQISSVGAAAAHGFKVFGGAVVPVLGSVLAAGNIARQSYNIHQNRQSRARFKGLIQQGNLSSDHQESVEFARTTLKKQNVRSGIEIGLSSVDMVNGVLVAATPMGTAAGTAIAAGTTGVRLGQIATRKLKQKARDKVAKSRDHAKNPNESFDDWAKRQQTKGIKGKLHAAVTPNWSKSSDKKKEAYIRHATNLAHLDEAQIFEGLGLDPKELATLSEKEKIEAIIKALQKR